MQTDYIKREKVFVSVFLFLICLGMAHAVHTGWFMTEYERRVHPPQAGTPYTPLFETSTHLPDAYRIAMPALGRLVMKVSHIYDAPAIAAIFDFISGFAASYLFYRLAVDRLTETKLAAILFLAMIQFGMSWVVPWQRSETMPTSLFLAVILFSLVRIRESLLWAYLIVIATLIQGFIRTDVPFVLGVSMVLLGLLRGNFEIFSTRRVVLFLGGVVIFITITIQAYLRYVRFPNLHRWPSDKPILTFSWNMHNLHSLVTGFVSLLPFVLFAVFLALKRPALDVCDKLILIVSALYLAVWFNAGLLSEPRIFVPFMFALSSVTAKILGSHKNIPEFARRVSQIR